MCIEQDAFICSFTQSDIICTKLNTSPNLEIMSTMILSMQLFTNLQVQLFALVMKPKQSNEYLLALQAIGPIDQNFA